MIMTRLFLIPALSASLLGSAVAQTADPTTQLQSLIAEWWAWELAEDPLLATSVGEHAHDHQLPSETPEDHARRAAMRRDYLARLDALDASRLGTTDRVSYDMFRTRLVDALAEVEFRAYEIPLTADFGFHTGFAQLPREMPIRTVDGYEDYVARLRAFPRYVEQHIANMRAGLARGFTLARVVLEGYEGTISAHVVSDPEASAFWRPFAQFPSTVPAAQHERLRAAGRQAIMEGAVAGYAMFFEFMTREYIPGARATLGASQLPRGREYYAYLVRRFTTLDRTAQQIHQLGLEEVTRIRAAMKAIIEEVGFEGDFAAFLEFLRTDPQFYATTAEELLKEASYIAKRMDGKLPALFGKLPRLPYSVAPVPDEIAPKFTGGRYVGTPPGSTEPGYYWVNTYKLDSRPLYVLPALTLHEAVPGHHLQTALAMELDGLPEFRRHAYVNAFGEGWGLYSEYLGIEAGMYTTPYERFGRLTYEMWRACRLVVDTGIHAMGWSRQRAIDYLASHTALSIHEVTTETDRYISWPGQALAYKMGELTIRRLRQEAEAALGTRFDVRGFHDVVLGQGTLPLTILQSVVRRWIAAQGS